jgi:hypothetical protein
MKTTHFNATNLILEFKNAVVIEKVKLDSGHTIINSPVGNGCYRSSALVPPVLECHLSWMSVRVEAGDSGHTEPESSIRKVKS